MTLSNVKVLKTVEISGENFEIISGDYILNDGQVIPNYIDGRFVWGGENKKSIRLPRKFWGMQNDDIARQILAEGI